MKIDFYLRFKTRFGQKIKIRGNFSSLSNELPGVVEMIYFNEEFWHASIQIQPADNYCVTYQYIFTTENGEEIIEGEEKRIIDFSQSKNISIIDTWNSAGAIENAFYTAPFKNVYFDYSKNKQPPIPLNATHLFKIKAPLLSQDECICLVGSAKSLNEWDATKPVLLSLSDDWWHVAVSVADEIPVTYKYGIYNIKKAKFIRYESGDNRVLPFRQPGNTFTILHDGFFRMLHDTWKGTGVSVPVFSLRSKNSFGIGEFTDIKLLVDWAAQSCIILIQLLPINDTSATFTQKDSYPYASISAFALHPVYINLQVVAGKKNQKLIKALSKKQKQLNGLADVAYEKVVKFKMLALKELYELEKNDLFEDEEFRNFFKANRYWLQPYAAFCLLRDKYGTSEFGKWKTHSTFNEDEVEKLYSFKSRNYKEIAFWYFVQYHLHLQLKDVANYAHSKKIVLKGDIAIGVYRNGCDAWTNPELYNMHLQAGAPPDDFTAKGQNWGFPTYNWQRMQQDHFEWWRQRFQQMSAYFDAFRIDHILGFFRIWSIPVDAVEGIMGVFIPAIPVHINEFKERQIWFDYDRYCKPFITEEILNNIFHKHAGFVKETFLYPNKKNGYDLLEEFNTQRKVEHFFAEQDHSDENDTIRQGLFYIITNVLFFEQPNSNRQQFHFRISIDTTISFNYLDDATKYKLKELYADYFYRRQDEFWKKEAMHKLPELKNSTNMLICGEDLGMVPHSVPEVMKQLGILSLEIQRMPKDPKKEFFHPKDAPYLSVITPSTHDMSTIRGRWEENREKTQKYFNTVLQANGDAPFFCEAWINRAIVLQHLYSPAMWSIFQLQDILGMSETLRRENPHDERINQPANPNHFWKYRMHLMLEDLIRQKEFSNEVFDYIKHSGRGVSMSSA